MKQLNSDGSLPAWTQPPRGTLAGVIQTTSSRSNCVLAFGVVVAFWCPAAWVKLASVRGSQSCVPGGQLREACTGLKSIRCSNHLFDCRTQALEIRACVKSTVARLRARFRRVLTHGQAQNGRQYLCRYCETVAKSRDTSKTLAHRQIWGKHECIRKRRIR